MSAGLLVKFDTASVAARAAASWCSFGSRAVACGRGGIGTGGGNCLAGGGVGAGPRTGAAGAFVVGGGAAGAAGAGATAARLPLEAPVASS